MSNRSPKKRDNDESLFINNVLTILFALISAICFIFNVKSNIFIGIGCMLIIVYFLHFIPSYRSKKSKYHKINRIIEGIANDIGILLYIITCMNFIDYSEKYIYQITGFALLILLFISIIVNMKKVGIKNWIETCDLPHSCQ